MSWQGKQEEKRRMEKLYREAPTYRYSARGVYKDKRGVYRKAYPYSTNHDNVKRYFQTLANRKTRRRLGNEDTADRCGHKKLFDLWWTLL